MELVKRIKSANVQKSEIAIFWLGQAGFLIKDSEGRKIAIDPYLTDCCEKEFGFKRLSPKLISPKELTVDILFSTHEHLDHFDIDAVPIIMKNKNTKLVGAKPSIAEARKLGIDEEKLFQVDEGDTLNLDWVSFTGVYADHGELAPEAIGVLVKIDGITIYYTGDTAYRPENMKAAIDEEPDIIMLPINGAYGNLNAEEAVKLVKDTKAKVAVPCHFWTFAVHGGDPQIFDDEMKKNAPDTEAKFLEQGEMFIYCGA